MATSQLTGMYFTLEGDTIEFFGAKGTKFSEDRWGINAFDGDVLVAVKPDSIMDRVRDCISSDTDAGNEGKIAQLQLGARQAVVLFLEGILTRKHLMNAIEGPEFIDIHSVNVEGHILTVHVTATPKIDIATADVDGNVL